MKKTSALLRWGTFVLLTLWGMACTSTEETPPTEASPSTVSTTDPTTGAQLRRSDLQLLSIRHEDRKDHQRLSGRVIPSHQTQLVAEVAGRILPNSLSFKVGTHFSKDAVLLQLDQQEFLLQLEAQRSTFFQALTAMLPDLKSDYADHYATWLDYVQGYRAGAVLPPLPEAQSQEERFYLTSRQIYSQYYGIKAQEERLRKYTIRAPYAGIITATQIDLGSYANPGQPLGTIIHRYQYELETGVDLKVASTLRMGDRVTFRSNEMPGSWVGKVLRNTNVVDPQTQNVSVFFRLEGKGLRPGMYLEGAYHSQTLEDVVAIPNRVLARDQSVLLLRDDVIVRQAVEPVEYLGDSLLIRGLHDGDLLILNQFDLPVEGNKIKI
ncbi:MAG: HlyD family efflux transporter periplasmic adaptor subunit [Bacteroidota bacterium]